MLGPGAGPGAGEVAKISAKKLHFNLSSTVVTASPAVVILDEIVSNSKTGARLTSCKRYSLFKVGDCTYETAVPCSRTIGIGYSHGVNPYGVRYVSSYLDIYR